MLNRISNTFCLLADIVPITGASTYNSEYINLADADDGHHEIVAYVVAGAISGSLSAKLVQATDASGTGKKDITGKSITQITTSDDIAKIELRQDDQLLDTDNGFTFVGLEITTSNAADAAFGGIFGGGCYAKHQDGLGPQSYDLADEVVRSTI